MSGRRQYLINVFWSWLSVGALILNGLILTPFLIRRLGVELNGIWVFALSLVEYFWMIDLGVRPATTKLMAEYRALNRDDQINSLINTALCYSVPMGTLVFCLVSFNTGWIGRFFHITSPDFPLLVQVVSVTWSLGLIFNVFSAAIEGLQRFDITNHIFVGFLLIRGVLTFILVYAGYRLREMSLALLASQLLTYVAFYIALRRIYPALRISPRLASKAAGREIVLYARQILAGILSIRVLTALIPSVITRSIGVSYVTYYSTAQRVLDYAADGIGRIGVVTGPRAAEWMARGYRDRLIRLAEYGNRYCLTLWLVFGTFLLVYADRLFRLWVNQAFADQAAPLLRIMLFGYTLWLGQFASAAILMGIARYSEYSASLMAEALIIVAGFAAVLPFYGLKGGVVIFSVMIFLNRCVNLSRIYTKKFHISQVPFLWRVYRTPLALAAVDVALLWTVQRVWIPGRTWPQLVAVGTGNALLLAGSAFWLVLEPAHRELFLEKFAHLRSRIFA